VGAPGPTHEDGRRMRRLGTDGVAETEARRNRDGLPEGRQRWGHGQNEREGSSFIAMHCVGQCGPAQGGRGEVTTRRDGRATDVYVCAARRNNDVAVTVVLRGDDAEGVCPYAVGTGELDRNGERASHAAGGRVPVHGAYSARRAGQGYTAA
jgi:hypothetical protein